MFCKKKTQASLFESSLLVPPAKAGRMRATWAEVFRTKALPLIREEDFAFLYCDDNGRPNRPVQTVLGFLLLKEMHGLTDAEALEQLEYNLLWHCALQLTPEEAHLPQKTVHNFRARLMAHEGGKVAFVSVTDRIIGALGTNVARQRLDSTHAMSNIAVLTRLRLFCETVRLFLGRLGSDHPRLRDRVSPSLLGRYLKPEGGATGFQDARSSEGRRRLSVCARDLYRLCELFEDTAAKEMREYGLLKRLLAEQCEMRRKRKKPRQDDDDAGEGGVPIVLKDPKKVRSDSLQSPHDPDVTYSGRKGKGYEVQIAETCHEDNAVQLITHVEVTDACASDAHATIPVLQALADRGQQPNELVADTTYGSGENAVAAQRTGTELISPVGGPTMVEEVPAPDSPLTLADFDVDPSRQKAAICPQGYLSIEHNYSPKQPNLVRLIFDRATCAVCPLFERCPAEAKGDDYVLHVDLVAANLDRRRRAEATGEFRKRYAIRAGIEATNSELKRRHGLGFLRVRGRRRVKLAVYLKALACNLKRMICALTPKLQPLTPTTA